KIAPRCHTSASVTRGAVGGRRGRAPWAGAVGGRRGRAPWAACRRRVPPGRGAGGSAAVGELPGVLGLTLFGIVAQVVVGVLLGATGRSVVIDLATVVTGGRRRALPTQHRERGRQVVRLHQHVAGLRALRGADDLAGL